VELTDDEKTHLKDLITLIRPRIHTLSLETVSSICRGLREYHSPG